MGPLTDRVKIILTIESNDFAFDVKVILDMVSALLGGGWLSRWLKLTLRLG